MNRKVGLVLFSSKIECAGDCSNTSYNVPSQSFNDFGALLETSQTQYENIMKYPINDCAIAITNRVNKLTASGGTALGPALVNALGLATQGSSGSKIILCTDGLANEGLGSLDGRNDQEAIKFYEKVADIAVQNGIAISIVTIKGTACRVDALGPLTDRTSGSIIRVDPSNLDFSELAKEDILATQVQLKVLLHEGLAFRNEDLKNLQNNGSILKKSIGNVTLRNE